MHWRRTVLLLLALALVAGIIGVVIVFLRAPARIVTLRSGIRVELLGTAVGGQPFSTEKSWERALRERLPRALTQWIPPPEKGTCSSGTNSVTVFVRVIDPTGAPVPAAPWANYETEDATGFRYTREGGYCSFGSRPGSLVFGLTLRAYPRRQSSFALRFLDGQGVLLASLQVPNPVPGPFPEWQPAPLPQTQTNGPVTLQLAALLEPKDRTWQSIQPRWILRASDPLWTHAQARWATLIDATGNEGSWLSRQESAWRLRTFVYRERPEDFMEGERLVLTNLAVPKPGEYLAIDHNSEHGGIRLTVHVLAGAGRFSITNQTQRGMDPPTLGMDGHSTTSSSATTVESWASQVPFFLLEAGPMASEDEIRFRLTDDQGREIKLDHSEGYNGKPQGVRAYRRRFHPPADVRFVNLELTINRPLGFEFLVNPAEIRPAPPSP